jgi:hypothetical protein
LSVRCMSMPHTFPCRRRVWGTTRGGPPRAAPARRCRRPCGRAVLPPRRLRPPRTCGDRSGIDRLGRDQFQQVLEIRPEGADGEGLQALTRTTSTVSLEVDGRRTAIRYQAEGLGEERSETFSRTPNTGSRTAIVAPQQPPWPPPRGEKRCRQSLLRSRSTIEVSNALLNDGG